jgi:hypothetical protein
MTYPTGAGSLVNNYGPYTPNQATSGATTPFVAPTAPAALLDSPGFASLTPRSFTSSWNYTNSELAMQVDLDAIEGPQQGVPAISNTAAVNLAGYGVGQLQFFKYQ